MTQDLVFISHISLNQDFISWHGIVRMKAAEFIPSNTVPVYTRALQ